MDSGNQVLTFREISGPNLLKEKAPIARVDLRRGRRGEDKGEDKGGRRGKAVVGEGKGVKN